VCHSDLSVVDGNRMRPVPMALGHEAAGIVEATGPEVLDVAPGQRVVLTFLPRCGHCAACRSEGRIPCPEGSRANSAGTLMSGATRLHRDGSRVNHHLGVSGFATYAVVDRRSVVAVDADVPPDVAALLGCAVLTGGGAVVNIGRPEPGQTVMVVGLGGVGMAALITAVGLGGLTVVGVDGVEDKLATARRLGAATTLTPQELADSGVKADVVIEAAGSARAVEAAVAATAVGGRTVTVGLPAPADRAGFSPLGLVAEGRAIIGSYLGSAVPPRDIPRYVEMWRAGRLPVEELVSSTIALDDINHAMDTLADGLAIRQLIHFDRDGSG
jgi:alcohol dehydrogenase